MTLRDSLQQGIYCVINPFVRLLIRMGVTPNIVTFIGFLGNLAAAALIVAAALCPAVRFSLILWAGILTIAFSLFDMLDGQVARLGNMASRFGAFFDSVLDRYCELFTVGAIAYLFMAMGDPISALIAFLALIGSIMVSYIRARAEGLGLECKVGFMQRPERVVVAVLGLIIAGACSSTLPLTIAMAFIALFANITAIARFIHCKRQF